MSVKCKLGVEIDGTFVSKEEVQSMSLNEFKMLGSFLGEKELFKVAKWHSESAQQYVEEVLNSCQYSYGMS
jgi:hypothetical protein